MSQPQESKITTSTPAGTWIFVYGTLKRGLTNFHYMEGQEFIGEASTLPLYRMVDCGGYPGMYEDPQNGLSIKGEVWVVDAAARARLDVLEGLEEGMYSVDPVQLQPPFAETKQTILAYFYRWPVTGLPDVGDDWKEC